MDLSTDIFSVKHRQAPESQSSGNKVQRLSERIHKAAMFLTEIRDDLLS